MSLDIGQDGVAGRQVTDTNAHKVFVHRRLPKQLIELRRRERERERVGGENGQTEEMINEAGNELHAITAASPIPEDCTLSLRKKEAASQIGVHGRNPLGVGAQIDI